jgi:hypothetical protein
MLSKSSRCYQSSLTRRDVDFWRVGNAALDLCMEKHLFIQFH